MGFEPMFPNDFVGMSYPLDDLAHSVGERGWDSNPRFSYSYIYDIFKEMSIKMSQHLKNFLF